MSSINFISNSVNNNQSVTSNKRKGADQEGSSGPRKVRLVDLIANSSLANTGILDLQKQISLTNRSIVPVTEAVVTQDISEQDCLPFIDIPGFVEFLIALDQLEGQTKSKIEN